MKKFNWKDYFYFNKKERRAAFVILLITGIVTIAATIIPPGEDDKYVTTKFTQELTDSVATLQPNTDTARDTAKSFVKNELKETALFSFDPNTLNEAGWKKLGVSDRVIHTIINYRNKGGHFYKPQDIEKIYGLDKTTATTLIPYIQIAGNKEVHAVYNDYHKAENTTYQHKQYKTIDINQATEEDWKSLPGIGDVLSKRIVKFRNAKGSFESIDDVADTYGLKDSVFQAIKPYLKFTPEE